MITVNLKENMPPSQVAVSRMYSALKLAQCSRCTAVKLIHGYGSTGQGGKIRGAVRRELRQLQNEGKLRIVVPGESFSPFNPIGLQAITLCFELTRDEDYQKGNPGITVVIL